MGIIDRLKNYLIDGIMREREKNIQICGEKRRKGLNSCSRKKLERKEKDYICLGMRR
ncbi:MAG: hypothetical protein LBD03_04185 [Methanobrevibacter sp.]|nr:hypothetical protein [Candidatus Methanovirga procula]